MAEDSEVTRTAQGLALYRKYRPATFAEVRGQDHVTAPLRQALRSGRINHAYLFSGPRGCGKTSSARILARSLNCVNGPTPDPCGVCDSCVALAPSGPGSIDVIEIDAASHGGVDDARDLRERAFYAPVAGRYKIYIIDEAHMVTQQGFNALLKLVEEPPPHLKFIFATTEPEKVIATIRSRTHHYPFRLMPPSVMRELLEDILNSEGVAFEPPVIPLVVRAGAGSARDSLSILDQLLAGSDADGIRYDRAVALLGYTDASLLDEMVDAFAAADGAAVFRAVNRVIEGGHEPRRFAADMLDRFRDLIVIASVPDAIETGLIDVPPDRSELMTAQASRPGLASLTRAAEIISTGLDQMRGATSPRLLLELMCAQVLLPAAATDERSVLARLERLESVSANHTSYPERSEPAPQRPPSPEPRRPSDSAQPASAGEPRAQAEQARPEASASEQRAQAEQVGPEAPASERRAQAERRSQAEPVRPEEPAPASATAQSLVAPPAPRGAVTTEGLRQAWPNVLDAVKAKGRVAAIVIGNASVVSLDEGVLTIRFPRQGDVKGFQIGGYEDLLKQVVSTMFGINVGIRAVAGGETAPPSRSPGPAPVPPPVPHSQPQSPPSSGASPSSSAAVVPAPEPPATPPGPPSPGQPRAGQSGPAQSGPVRAGTIQVGTVQAGTVQAGTVQAGGVPSDGGGLPPLPSPPSPDEDDFGLDDEDLSSSTVNELTGMALVQRELGGQVIGEYED